MSDPSHDYESVTGHEITCLAGAGMTCDCETMTVSCDRCGFSPTLIERELRHAIRDGKVQNPGTSVTLSPVITASIATIVDLVMEALFHAHAPEADGDHALEARTAAREKKRLAHFRRLWNELARDMEWPIKCHLCDEKIPPTHFTKHLQHQHPGES